MSLSLTNLLLLTWTSLWRNPLRSGLTLVGVYMGVLAVDATLKVGTISTAVMETELSKREAPRVEVWNRGMTIDHLDLFRQRLTGVEAIAARRSVRNSLTLFRDRQASPWAMAVSPDFFSTTGRRQVKGRLFNSEDFEAFRSVVIVDENLAKRLFEDEDPINQRIYLGGRPYVVVGVVNSLPTDGESEGVALLPISINYALTGSRRIGLMFIRPENLNQLTKLQEEVEQLLEQQFPGQRSWVFNNIEDILEQQSTLALASRGLAAVGFIALLVGGVGIANITIASVMERTPEIGLRLAIGATERDILYQFILEATLLSFLGGVMAISTVHGLTLVVAHQFDLPYRFNPKVAGASLGSALLVGMVAGSIPAWQASKLDPVKALRS
ncbi:ABC transporter permease [Roseofilum casamattae]|uniref:ABC transporter permease n=1 Tax=Roseofilum casamattae BLCC-M143 TaxID=3022442 RepID=A0ABT7BVB3_9CYAN|nr:ABC transporter permease [Roseofilum casamattae]MDJ1183035.1 ABC transporter permease [Roseofilum casamattae BLCC-M143]